MIACFGVHRSVIVAVVASLFLFVGTTAATAAPFEPNDTYLQAVGPVTGGTNYDMTFETSNDEDWFYFYTAGQAQLSLKMFHLSGDCYYAADMDLLDSKLSHIKNLNVNPDYTNQLTDEYLFTVPGAKKFYLKLYNQRPGCSVRFRIDPASAVTSVEPPSELAVSTCRTAITNVKTFGSRLAKSRRNLASNRRKLRSTNAKLRRARTRAAKRALRSKARTYRRKIRSFTNKVNVYTVQLNGAAAEQSANCTPKVLELIQNEDAANKS